MIVSTVGLDPGFSSLYTTNSGEYTATIQTALQTSHAISSFDYMDRSAAAIAAQFPELRTFFSSGSMVDAVLNMGTPAPIDLQISSADLDQAYRRRPRSSQIASRSYPESSEAYIPQDMNYPAVRLDVDRVHAAELGLTPEKCRPQRHHRPQFQPDDRAQLLARPQNRKRLLPHRPILRKRPAGDPRLHRPQKYSAARPQLRPSHNPRYGGQVDQDPDAHRNRSLPDSARRWIFT